MRGLLLDLDGVIYVGDAAVPGAVEAVAWLQRERVPHCFVTNTTSRPRAAVVEKLAGLGITVAEGDVLTPVVVSVQWLEARGIRGPSLFVPPATAAEFAGLDPVLATAESGAGAVVVGDLGPEWDFATLNRAFRLLMAEERPPLIALGATRYWRAEDGLRLDAGAYVRALEYASGQTAVVLGKPNPAFYRTAVEALGLAPDQVAMVGDDIRADVQGAQDAGLAGVLVQTGKFGPSDLGGEVRPDAVLDSVAELPSWWTSQAARPAR